MMKIKRGVTINIKQEDFDGHAQSQQRSKVTDDKMDGTVFKIQVQGEDLFRGETFGDNEKSKTKVVCFMSSVSSDRPINKT